MAGPTLTGLGSQSHSMPSCSLLGPLPSKQQATSRLQLSAHLAPAIFSAHPALPNTTLAETFPHHRGHATQPLAPFAQPPLLSGT